MDERQLIESCRKGERLAQKQLYDTFSRKMMGVCLRYVNDRETARDLLQEGFVKVFSSIDSYMGNGSFEGWIRKIFVNVALEYLRRNDVMRETVDLDEVAELSQPDSSAVSELSANGFSSCASKPASRTNTAKMSGLWPSNKAARNKKIPPGREGFFLANISTPNR